MEGPFQSPTFVAQCELLQQSYGRLLGRSLLPTPADTSLERARQLWAAPFAVVSHGVEAEPVFNFGNRVALELFEMSWADFRRLPSKRSAELDERGERERLLQRVTRDGFIGDYSGVRITRTGRRFRIQGAAVWNLVRDDGQRVGQAATFDTWTWL